MGMKVAAVSVMCQDQRVFDAMMNAGTPCPKDGLIGDAAKAAWEVADNAEPEEVAEDSKGLDTDEKTLAASGGILVLLAALLL